MSRIPVCAACLKKPIPITAEYFCLSCKTPFQNRFPLEVDGRCLLCRSGSRGFDEAFCFGSYEDTLRELIHIFKYGGVRTLAGPLSGYLRSALPQDGKFDAIVPMPLHWLRQWRRGFNQSQLLANALARRLGIPAINAVSRVHHTQTQTGLSNSKRRENVAGAFRVKVRRSFLAVASKRRPTPVSGLRILLVDDVMTTGATASACAATLKRAGAKSVTLLTIARVDRRFAVVTTKPKSMGASQ